MRPASDTPWHRQDGQTDEWWVAQLGLAEGKGDDREVGMWLAVLAERACEAMTEVASIHQLDGIYGTLCAAEQGRADRADETVRRLRAVPGVEPLLDALLHEAERERRDLCSVDCDCDSGGGPEICTCH